MRHAHDTLGGQSLHYALDTLHALPCGCVAAVYRAYPLETGFVSVEARGPHCLYVQHEIGRVLGLTTAERPTG